MASNRAALLSMTSALIAEHDSTPLSTDELNAGYLTAINDMFDYIDKFHPAARRKHAWVPMELDRAHRRCYRCGLREGFRPISELRPDGKPRAVWIFPGGGMSLRRGWTPDCTDVQNKGLTGHVPPKETDNGL